LIYFFTAEPTRSILLQYCCSNATEGLPTTFLFQPSSNCEGSRNASNCSSLSTSSRQVFSASPTSTILRTRVILTNTNRQDNTYAPNSNIVSFHSLLSSHVNFIVIFLPLTLSNDTTRLTISRYFAIFLPFW